jgi:hypothetical protein
LAPEGRTKLSPGRALQLQINPIQMIKPLTLTLAAACCALLVLSATPAYAGNKNKDKSAKPGKLAKQYDTNGNGIIDGDEVEALRNAFNADPTGPLHVFDTNNDGKLDDSEIAAIKAGHKGGKKGKKNKS